MLKRLVGLHAPDPSWFEKSAGTSGVGLSLTYLGTAGFVLSAPERTLVLDPFLSRPDLTSTLLRPLRIEHHLLRRHIPYADDVLVGHAHYDHVLDAPELCRQTGARLIGARAVCMVGRAAGLPEGQLVETSGNEDIASGNWRIRGLPSRHGKVFMGRVALAGDIEAPPPWPPRVTHLRHGQVLNWWVDTGRLRILHIDSADFINEELANCRADLVCLCAIGRQARPNYVRDIVERVRPKWIVPCHWDSMITPYESEPECLPGVDLPGFVDEIRAAGVTPVVLPMRGAYRFPWQA